MTVWVRAAVAPLAGDRGQPESFIAVVEDIHERHIAEEEGRLHEERARLALDIARLGTWSWGADTAGVEADKRTREICGLPPVGAIEIHHVGTRVHREDWPRVRDTARRAFETGRPFAAEFRFVHPDGSVRWVVVRGRVVPASQTSARAPLMLGSVLDVTARRTAEEALRMADRQKDEFLAMLSHELRNPLAPDPQRGAPPQAAARPRRPTCSGCTRRHRTPGAAPGAAGRRPARRLARRARQDRAAAARRSTLADVVATAVETTRPLIERSASSCSVDAAAASPLYVARRPGPPGAGGRQPAAQRRQVHRRGRPIALVAAAAGRARGRSRARQRHRHRARHAADGVRAVRPGRPIAGTRRRAGWASA